MKMKMRIPSAIAILVIPAILAIVSPAQAQADCTQASLTWSYNFAGNPLVNAVCSPTVTANCYVQFIAVDSAIPSTGSFPIPITILPSPLGNVDNIPSGWFKATHKVGEVYAFNVFVDIHDQAGSVVRSLPSNLVTLTCGATTPPPVSPNNATGSTR